MILKYRIAKLERRAGLNEDRHITLINPDDEDVERASRVSNATLFILDIGGPKALYSLPAEDAG